MTSDVASIQANQTTCLQEVEQDVLRLPSVILSQLGVATLREYAAVVYRCIQQTNSEAQAFVSAFLRPEEATAYAQHVHERLNCSVPCTESEECIILPPLFLRSCENKIYELGQNLFLVTYKNGPMIPVIRLRHNPGGFEANSPSRDTRRTNSLQQSDVIKTTPQLHQIQVQQQQIPQNISQHVQQKGQQEVEQQQSPQQQVQQQETPKQILQQQQVEQQQIPQQQIPHLQLSPSRNNVSPFLQCTNRSMSLGILPQTPGCLEKSISALKHQGMDASMEQKFTELTSALILAYRKRSERELMFSNMSEKSDINREILEQSLARANENVQRALRAVCLARSGALESIATTKMLLMMDDNPGESSVTSSLRFNIENYTHCEKALGLVLESIRNMH